MSTVFVDTSAALVPLDRPTCTISALSGLHPDGSGRGAVDDYVVHPCRVLFVDWRRLGLDALTKFRTDFAPVLDVAWIGLDQHERGLDLLEESRSAKLSLVDAVSFVVARDRDVERVFAFDPHFTTAGFTAVS